MAQSSKKRTVKKVTPIAKAVVDSPSERSTLERILGAIPEGRMTAIDYVRQLAYQDQRYEALIRDFDADPKADLGHLAFKHKIAPQDFLADINREMYPVIDEAMKFAHGLSSRIVAARLPGVVERGMIEGKKADGVADRHFVLQKEGFHIAPKGTVISMTQVNQQAAGLESFADGVKEMASILDGAEEPLELTDGVDDFIDLDIENELQEEIA